MPHSPLRRLLAVVTTTAAIAISSLAVWYSCSPAMTLEAMANAAERRDGDGVAVHMDMLALRISTRMLAEETLRRNVPSDRVVLNHHVITEVLVGRVIDDIFTRHGTDRVVRGQSDPIANRGALSYRIALQGPDRFIARLDAPRRVDLLFIRHGATWLLSAIRMRPAEAPRNYI